MKYSKDALNRLQRFNKAVCESDSEIAVETADLRPLSSNLELAPSGDALGTEIVQESIILRRQRPVLRVIKNETELKFSDEADSNVWKQRLLNASEQLGAAIPSVGRINLDGGRMDWVGTGWLVKENIIVTNRHVAELFTSPSSTGFVLDIGPEGEGSADIDFLKEFESSKTRRFELIKPLYVAPRRGPDIAFFEVQQVGGDGKLAEPIGLAANPKLTKFAATIGYPAFDSRIPEIDLMEEIYGRAYNKKRLAPGAVTKMDKLRIWHDCTTLGGNSGSTVFDLDSGMALGLHFSGAFLQSNYAVRSDVVKAALDEVLRGGRPYYPRRSAPPPSNRTQSGGAGHRQSREVPQAATASVTIPLTISVSLGNVHQAPGVSASSHSSMLSFRGDEFDDDDVDDGLEARPEDYLDRDGYRADFLGDFDAVCPLPRVERDKSQILKFEFDGRQESELKYEHFSVVMNKHRRMCFFSAVNINGAEAKPASRVGWKWDPRIPRDFQIMKECYGRPPKFSRGHMTRRNDPSWGTDLSVAERGNEDSMHVTNATPQMQAFNSPIWLELEDYALENAVKDGMRISVFTGPIFSEDDPVYHGVAVPVAFWKVIAFIHDETGELSATGYRMSQEESLPSEEEFIFGAFQSTRLNLAAQVSIRSIEDETGISFNGLADLDPFTHEESLDDKAVRPLLSRHQVRFF